MFLDSFECTLRHITWERVQSLSEELLDFCAVTEKINQQKGLRLRLSHTNLLEGKVTSRDDYVRDIRDALSFPEAGIRLPGQILEHRQRLIDEASCRFKSWEQLDSPLIGHKWVNSQADKWRRVLEELDSNVRAVAKYVLDTVRLEAVAPEELPGWCLLSLCPDAGPEAQVPRRGGPLDVHP